MVLFGRELLKSIKICFLSEKPSNFLSMPPELIHQSHFKCFSGYLRHIQDELERRCDESVHLRALLADVAEKNGHQSPLTSDQENWYKAWYQQKQWIQRLGTRCAQLEEKNGELRDEIEQLRNDNDRQQTLISQVF